MAPSQWAAEARLQSLIDLADEAAQRYNTVRASAGEALRSVSPRQSMAAIAREIRFGSGDDDQIRQGYYEDAFLHAEAERQRAMIARGAGGRY